MQDFRKGVLRVIGEAVRVRQQCGESSLANYHHPAELESSATLPSPVSRKLDNGRVTRVKYVIFRVCGDNLVFFLCVFRVCMYLCVCVCVCVCLGCVCVCVCVFIGCVCVCM